MKLKELAEKHPDVELTEEQEKHIKEYLEIKNKKWRPEKEERYYSVLANGTIQSELYLNYTCDRYKYFSNNCFKTKEEAEFKLEQIKVYNELKNFADENNDEIDWNDSEKFKYYIYYHHKEKKLVASAYCSLHYLGNIHFSSKQLAEQAITKIGADRIKKYLFGVEDAEN